MVRKADDEVIRPAMVKIIARFELLAGIALLLFGAGLLALADLIMKSPHWLADLGETGLQVYGWAGIALGVVSFVVALGVWSMASSGRKMALAGCVVGIFIPVIVAGYLGQLTFIITLIVYPLIMYYLSREDIREKYG